tara:strand:+ start:225 stop:386 length:162 start_codon:yes stop_codon:yes gene_type:complete
MLAFKLDSAIGALHRLTNIIMQTQTKAKEKESKVQRTSKDEIKGFHGDSLKKY